MLLGRYDGQVSQTSARPPRATLAEFYRVLGPGGHLLLALQVGDDEHVHREQAYGHAVSLDIYRLSPDRVAEMLRKAVLVVNTRTIREPAGGLEQTQQAYLLAHKPVES